MSFSLSMMRRKKSTRKWIMRVSASGGSVYVTATRMLTGEGNVGRAAKSTEAYELDAMLGCGEGTCKIVNVA